MVRVLSSRLLCLAALLTACGGRSPLDEGEPVVDEGDWCPAGDECTVAARCEGAVLIEREATFVFDPPAGCAWGKDGNLEPLGGQIRARSEQSASLPLSPGEALCGMDVRVPTSQIEYDDHLLVTFDDVVILAALPLDEIDLFTAVNRFRIYEWAHLAGEPFSFGTYCLGERDGLGSCELPSSETEGQMTLTLSPVIVQELGYVAELQNRADVVVITTGDDNPEDDCRHSGFEVDVTVLVAAMP